MLPCLTTMSLALHPLFSGLWRLLSVLSFTPTIFIVYFCLFFPSCATPVLLKGFHTTPMVTRHFPISLLVKQRIFLAMTNILSMWLCQRKLLNCNQFNKIFAIIIVIQLIIIMQLCMSNQKIFNLWWSV